MVFEPKYCLFVEMPQDASIQEGHCTVAIVFHAKIN